MIWLLILACQASIPEEEVEEEEDPAEPERSDPIEDSALVTLGYWGQADLSVDWIGLETTDVTRSGNGELLCSWQYQTFGTPSIVEACVDPDGLPCRFAFDVALSDGIEVEGDCESFTTLDSSAGPYSYGYIDDYTAGGISYGAALLFYYRYDAQWRSVPGTVQFDADVAEFLYQWDQY